MNRRFYRYAPAFGKNQLMDDLTSSMVIFSLHILEITDKLTIIQCAYEDECTVEYWRKKHVLDILILYLQFDI